ncbi:hypothetical protein L1887_19060 [Cichorium endivia]|nr:hypothetical protein L1887_19060 [Cichorium endivia]
MEFSRFKETGIADNKIILSNTSSQPKPLTITDSMSMNIEEYMAYVQTEENQLQDLGGIDILQTDNTPKSAWDYRYNFPSSSSFVPYAQHAIGIPILYGGNMMPLMASSNGINLTMQTNASMAAYARQHRRMIRARHRQKFCSFDLKKLVDHFEVRSM